VSRFFTSRSVRFVAAACALATFAAAVLAPALASAAALPQPQPAHVQFTPPNCSWVETRGNDPYLECHLPPECHVETLESKNGGISVAWIECDMPEECELKSGQLADGTTFYWIVCPPEPECIGGCNPLPIPDAILKAS
jgi:hypothetical protein